MNEHTTLLCHLQAVSFRKGRNPARCSKERTSLVQTQT